MKSLRRLGLAAGAVLMLSTPLQAADIVIGIRSEPSSIDPYFHNKEKPVFPVKAQNLIDQFNLKEGVQLGKKFTNL